MTTAKRAYDRAAEAWHTHALRCPTCTLNGDERCQLGNDLLRAENEAWADYRHAAERVRIDHAGSL